MMNTPEGGSGREVKDYTRKTGEERLWKHVISDKTVYLVDYNRLTEPGMICFGLLVSWLFWLLPTLFHLPATVSLV